MFTLDEKLSSIETDESDVVELYRSEADTNMALPGHQAQACAVFVCSTRDYELFNVFAAICLKGDKKALVYRSDRVAGSEQEAGELVQEARKFAECMGFAVIPVDMNYSVAHREFLLRITNVFKPLDAATRTARKKAAAVRAEAAKKEGARRGGDGQGRYGGRRPGNARQIYLAGYDESCY